MGECKCSYRCNCVTIIISILIGVAAGIIFAITQIPVIVIFSLISLIGSVVSLAFLLTSLGIANLGREANAFSKCICSEGKCILIGSIGTLVTSILSLIIGAAGGIIFSTLLFGLNVFFFVWTLISILSFIWCLINKTCRYC